MIALRSAKCRFLVVKKTKCVVDLVREGGRGLEVLQAT